jgi:hypothetical protein
LLDSLAAKSAISMGSIFGPGDMRYPRWVSNWNRFVDTSAPKMKRMDPWASSEIKELRRASARRLGSSVDRLWGDPTHQATRSAGGALTQHCPVRFLQRLRIGYSPDSVFPGSPGSYDQWCELMLFRQGLWCPPNPQRPVRLRFVA